jgi:hypothetical protein
MWPAGNFYTVYDNDPNNLVYDLSYSTRLDLGAAPGQGDHAALGMTDTELAELEQLTDPLAQSGGLPPICTHVTSIQGMTVVAGGTADQVILDIQDKKLHWPRLGTDEEIAFSEIHEGLNLPESFFYGSLDRAPDIVRLSRTGDVLQGFAQAGNVAVVVMRNGAHRLERVGSELKTKRLGTRGIGTPWPDTILTLGTVAVWATTTGLRVYDPLTDQGTGSLKLIRYEEMLTWFTDALKYDLRVEAGYDERRGTIHFRRHWVVGTADEPTNEKVLTQSQPPGSTTTKEYLAGAAVFNLKTGKWSLVDDDSGFAYASSTHVETAATNVATLYSIDEMGAVFEENYEGVAHPYDALTVQDTLDPRRYTLITNDDGNVTGIQSLANKFGAIMTGDIVRFYATGTGSYAGLNGWSRRIIAADMSIIVFEALPRAPSTTDEFVIGATRFRVRFHAVQGAMPTSTQTLEGLSIVARPGTRHAANPKWADPPPNKFTVRAYRDFGSNPVAVAEQNVPIFDDDDKSATSDERFASIEAQGNAIEVEVECRNTRTDFTVSSITGQYRQDGDQWTDTSTDE